MPALATQPARRNIDLSKVNGPVNATVVVVPLPKNTVGIVFGVSCVLSKLLFDALTV